MVIIKMNKNCSSKEPKKDKKKKKKKKLPGL